MLSAGSRQRPPFMTSARFRFESIATSSAANPARIAPQTGGSSRNRAGLVAAAAAAAEITRRRQAHSMHTMADDRLAWRCRVTLVSRHDLAAPDVDPSTGLDEAQARARRLAVLTRILKVGRRSVSDGSAHGKCHDVGLDRV